MSAKILVVDDDPISLKLMKAMLERFGHTPITIQESKLALKTAEDNLPDIIILDVMMPEINGFKVAHLLRKNPKTAHIPIIMLTAMDSTKHRVTGFKAGADQYLNKPVHAEELAARIQSLLARNEARQATAPTQGIMLGVIGVKGGVGTTTVAINLAATWLAKKRNPLLVDFHTDGGTIGYYLGLGQTGGIRKLMELPEQGLTEQMVSREIFTHKSGLRAILCKPEPTTPVTHDGNKAYALKNALINIGDPVVIDMGKHYDLSLLNPVLDRVVLVTEPNPTDLEIAKPLIETIAEEGRARLSVIVVNRSQNSLQLTKQQIAKQLDLPVQGVIPTAAELAFQASGAHSAMIALQSGAMVSKQFEEACDELLVQTNEKGSLLADLM